MNYDEQTYSEWLQEVDDDIISATGIPLDEHPEVPGWFWHDVYEADLSPGDTVSLWLEELEIYGEVYFS